MFVVGVCCCSLLLFVVGSWSPLLLVVRCSRVCCRLLGSLYEFVGVVVVRCLVLCVVAFTIEVYVLLLRVGSVCCCLFVVC